MKLRKWLTKLNDAVRPPHVQREDVSTGDKTDAMTTMAGSEIANLGFGEGLAPTNWVSSQQDERPRH